MQPFVAFGERHFVALSLYNEIMGDGYEGFTSGGKLLYLAYRSVRFVCSDIVEDNPEKVDQRTFYHCQEIQRSHQKNGTYCEHLRCLPVDREVIGYERTKAWMKATTT